MITWRYEFGDVTIVVSEIPEDGGLSRRERERLAVSEIVRDLFGEDTDIRYTADGAPYIEGSSSLISVTHSRRFAALAVSPTLPIGIDIEEYRSQLRRVAPRVLSDAELTFYGQDDIGLLRAWTLKEALYKAALTPGLDFRRDINLPLAYDDSTARIGNRIYDVTTVDIDIYTLLSLARSI